MGLGIGGKVLKPKHSNLNILTPFSKTLDVLSIFTSNETGEKPKATVYGYLPYWTLDKYKYLQFDKLTNIAYFGLYIDELGNFEETQTVPAIDEKGEETGQLIDVPNPGFVNWKANENLERVIQKSKKNGVRVALTVIAHEDEKNDAFLNCRECWNTLLMNLARELDSKEITDVNLNFEYVESVDPEQAKVFLEFVRYLNSELDKVYGDSQVVVTTFADSVVQPRISSEIAGLGRYSDGLFVMAYDFHTTQSEAAGPVAPIDGKGSFNQYDIRTLVRDYLTQIPPNKLILGVPYYGYNWVVEKNEPYSKRIEGTDEIGFSKSQPYDKIMDLLGGNLKDESEMPVDQLAVLGAETKAENKAENKDGDKKTEAEVKGVKTFEVIEPKLQWDELAQVPWFTYTNPDTGSIRQVYFENPDSLKVKYKLVNENKLKGIGIWALGYDGEKNDLWTAINESFIKD